MKWIISFILLFLVSCSSSEDGMTVYDDVLSHTRWTQSYINNTGGTTSESFGIPAEIKNILDVEELPAVERTDTVWNIDSSKGKYVLTFANEDCELEDIHYFDGTYKIHTFIRKETYYPDQSHSWTDESGNRLYEVTISNDTLTFKETYIGEGMNEVFGEGKMYVEHTYDDTTLNLSTSFPYSKEKSEKYHMTFTRSERNIVLSGDKQLIGVLSEDGNSIEFSEVGKLYLDEK